MEKKKVIEKELWAAFGVGSFVLQEGRERSDSLKSPKPERGYLLLR
jgi:hypothetical protein